MEEAPVGFLSLRSSWPVLVGAPVGWISQLDFPTGFLNSISQLFLSVLCLDHSCESMLNSNPFSWGGCFGVRSSWAGFGLVGGRSSPPPVELLPQAASQCPVSQCGCHSLSSSSGESTQNDPRLEITSRHAWESESVVKALDLGSGRTHQPSPEQLAAAAEKLCW